MSLNYGRWLYALVVLLVVIAALYLSTWLYGALRSGGHIVALFFMAWLLQFFFTPVVDYLSSHHIPRLLAVIYVYLVLALIVVILGVWSVPAMYSQGQKLARELGTPGTYAVITRTTLGFEHFLEQHGVPRQDISNFTQSYSVSLKNGAVQVGSKLRDMITTRLNVYNVSASANAFLAFLRTLGSLLLDGVIVLILAFYLTLDGHRLMRRLISYFPPAAAEIMSSVQTIINRKFGGYLRGQAILAASYGVLTFVIAAGFRLQYTIFIAIFAAVMMLIPYVGTFAAVVPPLVGYVLANVAAPSFPIGGFILLLAFLIGSQQIVMNVLAPRVFSSAVGMHPILVIFSLLLGTSMAGIWGAIFGVPIFAALVQTADLIYRRVMDRRYGFQPPFGAEPDIDSPPSTPSSDAFTGPHTQTAGARPVTTTPPVVPRASSTAHAPPISSETSRGGR